MKKSVTIVFFLFVTLLTAQETKHLTLEDAVLGYSKGLYPTQRPMQWLADSNTFSYKENNTLFTETISFSGKNVKTPILQLEDLQNVLPDLKSFPSTLLFLPLG